VPVSLFLFVFVFAFAFAFVIVCVFALSCVWFVCCIVCVVRLRLASIPSNALVSFFLFFCFSQLDAIRVKLYKLLHWAMILFVCLFFWFSGV